MEQADSYFWMDGHLARSLQEVSDDPAALEDGNFWAVSLSFEGKALFARYSDLLASEFPEAPWQQLTGGWKSSQSEAEYLSYVSGIREAVAAGSVYQVNACRELSHSIASDLSLAGLFSELVEKNPAPFASYLSVNDLQIASASPERFLSRQGSHLVTSPIKGTIRDSEDVFGEKDRAENLMIVDLMRNDLGRICNPGSVEVDQLFRHEKHPGITHLVSDVSGELQAGVTWAQIFAAVLPPGSVSGAPKSAALSIIEEREGPRGPYCGILGWVHADRAELSVAIRTFWTTGDSILRFGTGAGITWGSDPEGEWEETQLKARRLISIAGGNL